MASATLPELLDLKKPNLSQANFGEIKEAIEILNPEYGNIYSSQGYHSQHYNFKNYTELKEFLGTLGFPKNTPDKYYETIISNWYENNTEAPEYSESSIADASRPDSLNQTIISERTNEGIFNDLKKQEEQLKQTREDSKIEVERFKKRGEEIYAEKQRIQGEIKAAEEAKVKLAGKVVFAKVILPEPLPLDEIEQKDLEILRQHAQDESIPDGGGFTQKQILIETLAKEIEVKIKPLMIGADESTIIEEARTAAVKIVEKIAKNDIKPNIESAIYLSIANDTKTVPDVVQNVDTLVEAAKKGSVLLFLDEEEKNGHLNDLAKNIFGPKLANRIIGPESEQIQVILSSTKPGNDYNEINLESLNQNYESSLKLKLELTQRIQSNGISSTRDFLSSPAGTPLKSFASEKIKVLQKAGKIPEFSPGIQGLLARNGIGTPLELTSTSRFGGYVLKYAPNTAPYWQILGEVTGVSVGIGVASKVIPLTFGGGIQVGKIVAIQQISIAKAPFTYAIATGNKIAIGAGTNVAVKTGVLAGFGSLLAKGATALGVSLGVFTAGVSTAITAATVAIGKMINWPKVKQWLYENRGMFAVGAGGLGWAIGGPIVGGVGLLGGLAAAGMLGTFAAGTFGVLGFIGRSIGIAIATPVIITLLVIPPLVAFIMLVINNSAYVVPPGNSLNEIGADNPYMLVTKIASPNKIDNPTSPQQVIYGVSIQALKESLFNVRITAVKCTITKKDGKKMVCPDEDVPPLEEGKSISPSQVHAFSFISRYDSRFNDSLAFDTIEVTAETADGTTVTTSGSAFVCIGDCPKSCLKIDGDWPNTLKANITWATTEIASKFPNYLIKVCSAYPEPAGLPLRYNSKGNGTYWGWNHNNYIDFYQLGVKTKEDALYTLAHELGHSIAWRVSGIYSTYKSFPGIKSEAPYCFYKDTASFNINESMQEAIAFRVIEPRCGSVQQKYPIHYKFIMNNIFN